MTESRTGTTEFTLGHITYDVAHAEAVNGLTPQDLSGMGHGIQGLVADDQAIVRVSLVLHADSSGGSFDPGTLRLVAAGSNGQVAPVGGSLAPGHLGPNSTIEGAVAFVVPRSGADSAWPRPPTLAPSRCSRSTGHPPGPAPRGTTTTPTRRPPPAPPHLAEERTMDTTPRLFARSGHLRPDVALAAVMTVVGSGWLAWLGLRSGALPDQGSLGPAALATALASAPETLLAVPVTLALLRDRGDESGASPTTRVIASSLVAAATLSGGNQLHALFAGSASSQLAVFALVGDALSLLTVLLPTAVCAALITRHRGRPRDARRSRTTLVAVLAAAVAAAASLAASPAQASSSPSSGCLSGGPADKTFDVSALDVNIPVNRFGDHDPKGKMYALTSRVTAIRDQERSQQVAIGLRDDAIQPLVVRANEGDCVEVSFLNSASGGTYGLHIDGLEFTSSSSGDAVGANPSSAVAQGVRTTYRFAVPNDPRMEGAHYIHPGPGYRSAVDHGLFGALVVEPPGSTYWNASVAGQPLESGWEAIIKPLGVNASCDPGSHTASCGFREAALLHHEIGNDNESLTDKTGHTVPQVDELTGSYRPGGFALNYRSEPFRNRLLAFGQEKSHAYSSYTFGDPATPMPRGYLSDPTKIRLLHAGGEKFHIYHLHGGGDRWRYNPVADTTYNYADTGLRKDPCHRAVTLPATGLPGHRPGRELQPGDRGRRRRRPAVLRRLPLPLPHRQALRERHVELLEGVQHAAARPRAARRPAGPGGRRGGRRPDRAEVQRCHDHGGQPRRVRAPPAAAGRRSSRRPGRDRLGLEGLGHP